MTRKVWHQLCALGAAILIPTAFAIPFMFRPPAPSADATTSRHVASALAAATAPYDPIVILSVVRLADSATMAHAVEHQCVIGDQPVTLLSTVQWEGSATTVVWANRQESRRPGCHDVALTLPLPPHDDLVDPRIAVVELPLRPGNTGIGSVATATSR